MLYILNTIKDEISNWKPELVYRYININNVISSITKIGPYSNIDLDKMKSVVEDIVLEEAGADTAEVGIEVSILDKVTDLNYIIINCIQFIKRLELNIENYNRDLDIYIQFEVGLGLDLSNTYEEYKSSKENIYKLAELEKSILVLYDNFKKYKTRVIDEIKQEGGNWYVDGDRLIYK